MTCRRTYEYVNNLEKRLRLKSPDPEERVVTHLRAPRDLEAMPFPLNGRATGFEDMLKEEERLGELNYEVPPIKEVARRIWSTRRSKNCADGKSWRKSTSA